MSEQDLKNDAGGGDQTIESAAPAAEKKRLDPGFKRNLIIIGGVSLAGVVAVILMLSSGGNNRPEVKPSSVNIGSGGGRVPTTELAPAMEQMLLEKEGQESVEAAKRGKSYVPADPRPTQPVAPELVSPQVTGSAYAQEAFMGQGAGDHGNRVETYQRQREGLERQLEGLIAVTSPGAVSVRQRVDSQDKQVAQADAAGGSRTVSSGGSSRPADASADRGSPVISGHYIAAAVLANKLDVPAGKPVYASAKIQAGPMAGAFLTGAATVVNEGLELRFDKMSFKGKFYQVNVTALDEQTAANALSGSVDRRVLQRWVMPVAMATVGKFFEAKSQTGTTIVNVGGGFQGPTQGLQTPPPSEAQARAAGVSAGIAIAQREVERSAQAPIVVSKESNTPMGLLFNAPVYEGDAK